MTLISNNPRVIGLVFLVDNKVADNQAQRPRSPERTAKVKIFIKNSILNLKNTTSILEGI
ncbi:MAG: hypothetical protein EA341_06230 [Mongoliibacter sp.]|nr:MAG: hypothetical protein EA341_06230 [Mongoliibacter sp.]